MEAAARGVADAVACRVAAAGRVPLAAADVRAGALVVAARGEVVISAGAVLVVALGATLAARGAVLVVVAVTAAADALAASGQGTNPVTQLMMFWTALEM